MWLLFSFMSAFFGALVPLVVKLKLHHVNSLILTCMHFLVMFFVLFSLCCLHQKVSFSTLQTFSSKEWSYLIINGIIGAIAYLSFFMAIKQGVPSQVLAVDRLSIIVIFIMSILLLKQSFSIYSFVGAFLVVIGTYLIAH